MNDKDKRIVISIFNAIGEILKELAKEIENKRGNKYQGLTDRGFIKEGVTMSLSISKTCLFFTAYKKIYEKDFIMPLCTFMIDDRLKQRVFCIRDRFNIYANGEKSNLTLQKADDDFNRLDINMEELLNLLYNYIEDFYKKLDAFATYFEVEKPNRINIKDYYSSQKPKKLYDYGLTTIVASAIKCGNELILGNNHAICGNVMFDESKRIK